MEKLNIIPHQHKIGRQERSALLGHPAVVLWFTGLSGSGKSTIAGAVEAELYRRKMHTYLLDGDNVRAGLNGDLSFSEADRRENLRRIGEVAHLFVDAGLITLTAFISPFRAERQWVRERVGEERFLEIFVKCPLSVCEERDVKGLYKKARKGEISNFTGISSPFEEPENPDLILESDKLSLEECVQQTMAALNKKFEKL